MLRGGELRPVPEEPFAPPWADAAKHAVQLRAAAKALGSIGRPEEMLQCCLPLCRAPEAQPTDAELLALALKGMVRPLRVALREAKACERSSKEAASAPGAAATSAVVPPDAAKEVRRAAERDVAEACEKALGVLQDLQEQRAAAAAAVGSRPDTSAVAVLLKTLQGDYSRHMCDVSHAVGAEAPIKAAEAAYEEAAQLSEHLPRGHPLRLGVALNRSVFAHEVLKIPAEGMSVAKMAFDEQQGFDALDPVDRKRAAGVLSLLRENVTLWTEGLDREDEVDDGGDGGYPYQLGAEGAAVEPDTPAGARTPH
eukprot:TRINITY_DN8336_c0_g2_i1.p1 TRINITY_DN8336_c0_g2~~TRINITY_DN8336_c0_g2_i1.p1  ORF type:complete len:311 (+),score=82.27 TRINITY_DN8336_c0_g2_i1:68-1000(+)